MSYAKCLVAQIGARRHYLIPILFNQWGNLEKFCTDFYSVNSGLTQVLRQAEIYKYLPNTLKKGLDRYDPALEKAKVVQFPRLAYKYTQSLRRASIQELSKIHVQIGKEFCQKIIRHGLGDANVIYGFNGASLELFEYAQARGIRCILDQTIAERALVYKLLLEEEQYWQNWSLSPFSVNAADLELMQREQHEQDLADHIICGSDFVKHSLIARGINANNISVVTLGRCKNRAGTQCQTDSRKPQQQGDELRILFAGTVGLRKGIPYLLKALRELEGKISFTCKVAGSIQIKPQRIAEYSDICSFLGVVPRSQMSDLYTWADVFVLPSICEGSAMVVYEAMSYGIPVITTPHSGSIIRDCIDGFVIPVRDSSSITNKLLNIYANKLNREKTFSSDLYQKQVFHSSELKLMQAISKN